MDTSDSEIEFDHAGRCNHCRAYEERIAKLTYRGMESQRELDAIVGRIKQAGRAREYDCVLGISGGVDSCYTAYVAKSLGLRPLAVHMDNGWDSDTAVRNIKNVAARLGIDYQSYVLEWDEFKDLQLSFLKASVIEIETPTDMAIPAALHRVAAEHRVKFIISGGNYATEGILPKTWHYDAKDVRYLKAIHDRFGTRKLRSFPTFGCWSEAYFKLIRGIRYVYPLNYVPYSKAVAVKCLESELGWKSYGGKHHESKITAFVQSYILPVKFGIDYRRATLSTQICAGEVGREDALKQLGRSPFEPATIDGDKEYVAKKFDITRGELERILALPPRSYRDYPNEQRFLEALYYTYRRFFGPRRALGA
jgi:N-acetyl sugar amidotransferase